MKRGIFLFTLLLLFLFSSTRVTADEIETISKQITEIRTLLEQSRKTTKPLEENIAKIERDIGVVEQSIAMREREIQDKKKAITQEEKALAEQKKTLDSRLREYYKKMKGNFGSSLGYILSSNIATALRQIFLQEKHIQSDRDGLLKTAFQINTLIEKKTILEQDQQRLAEAKAELAKEKSSFENEIAGARNLQRDLENQIVQLTARQQAILSQRLASLNIPRSAGTSARGCSDDRGVDPGFSPRIAFFTYGAPHRNGLNQYGAWGRAKSGQNEEQILSEYYPGFSLRKDYDQNARIAVDGHGDFTIENYVKRIYEVPDSWTDNNLAVLKAQAVAARTYALNKMNRIGSICTTESCQVFKPDPKGGNWEQAVNATAGWVLIDGSGSPGFTEYASTHGGYVLNIGKFDGSGGNPGSFAELNERAYDKESPWFYCDWGSRGQNNTAWLRPEEVADIVNTLILVKRKPETAENLYQPDKPNPAGKETWSAERVRSELGSSALSVVNSVSVSADFNSGRATSITINGESFSATEFKDRFNLRAPANIQIVGPLFNVETR